MTSTDATSNTTPVYTKLDSTFKKACSGRFTQYRGGIGTTVSDIPPEGTSTLCCLGVGAAVRLGRPTLTENECPGTNSACNIIDPGLNDDTSNFLIAANDRHRWSFAEIASWIDVNL